MAGIVKTMDELDELLEKSLKKLEKSEPEEKEAKEANPKDISDSKAVDEVEDDEKEAGDGDADKDEDRDFDDDDDGDEDEGRDFDDDGDGDDGDDGDEDEEDDEDEEEEKLGKSIWTEIFGQNEKLQKSFEVSEFLEGFADANIRALARVNHELKKSMLPIIEDTESILNSNHSLMKANIALVKINEQNTALIKSIATGLEVLNEKIDKMSNVAESRKSVLAKGYVDRDFTDSIGITENLSKGEVLTVLTNEFYAKNPLVTQQDILGVEAGAPLRKELEALVRRQIKK